MDTNLLTNKIVSIIIALVVALCVLVPIADSYGGGGGGSSQSLSDIATPLRLVDFDTVDLRDYENGELVLWSPLEALYRVSDNQYSLADSSAPQTIPSGGISPTQFYAMEDGELYYGPGQYMNFFAQARNQSMPMYINDGAENATHWLITDVNYVLPEKYKDSASIYIRGSYVEGDSYNGYHNAIKINTDGYVVATYHSGLEATHIDFNTDAIKLADISINDIYDSTHYTYPNSTYPANVSGILIDASAISEDGSGDGGSDTGMVGTLVRMVPLFVILAILLSVVTLMTGRSKELELD